MYKFSIKIGGYIPHFTLTHPHYLFTVMESLDVHRYESLDVHRYEYLDKILKYYNNFYDNFKVT